MIIYIFQKAGFILRFRFIKRIKDLLRNYKYSALGMRIGKGTMVPKIYITWPHKVSIGDHCILEQGVYFKFDGIWERGSSINIGNNVFIGSSCEFNIRQRIDVGNDTLIASGCRFIDHDHGMLVNQLIRNQLCFEQAIIIGKDVWLGSNVVVLKGVVIGDGAIVAAGAIVTKSILSREIWAGVPAKKIGIRK